MRRVFLGLAAAAAAVVLPAAAAAQFTGGGSGSHWSGGGGNGGGGGGHGGWDGHDGDRGHNGKNRRGGFSGGQGRQLKEAPDGAWGYYEGDYDANRAFSPDKWNDWWHERTDRSYPRWVQESQATGQCDTGRSWWSGSGWHC